MGLSWTFFELSQEEINIALSTKRTLIHAQGNGCNPECAAKDQADETLVSPHHVSQ